MDKKTLILPDLHHKVDLADEIIKKENPDIVICLGDVFDDFDDYSEMVAKSAAWLVNFVKDPNHIFIRGNHDISYELPNQYCSGHEEWKQIIINDIVKFDTWTKLKWYHNLDDNFLLTHAGLHSTYVPDEIKSIDNNKPLFLNELSKFLDESIIQALRDNANGIPNWVMRAGKARGGLFSVGGIVWCDFDQEFRPTFGLNQILGHTPQRQDCSWMIMDKRGLIDIVKGKEFHPAKNQLSSSMFSCNINLDVHNSYHYAIWSGNRSKLKIVKHQN